MNLFDLGYNNFFEESRQKLGFGEFAVARVISESRGSYRVKNENGEYLASVTGKQMFWASSREDYPAVGDWAVIVEQPGGKAVIEGVLPRFSVIKRRYGDKNKEGEKSDTQVIAANIDVAFIVESADRDYSLNRFERYISVVESGGVRPAIVLNKIDLLAPEELMRKTDELKNRFPGIDIIPTSTINREGLGEMFKYIAPKKTYCFLGSSGVGKSSLINEFLGEALEKTGDIGLRSGKGKHVTTRRQMYFQKSGGIVIDNPGMREIGLTDAVSGVESLFKEIAEEGRKCRYADCTHTHEPGCAVTDATRLGKLNQEKYANYINLKKEAEYYELSDREKRDRDKQFGKFLKNAKKDLQRFGK